MIELVNVSKYYTSNGVTNKGLININLKLNRGEIVAITGESGSGKSTLLNVITKVDSFDEGEIYYKGNETSYFSINDMDQFRKDKIGFIFQNYNIIDSYTVLENVMLPLIINGASKNEAKQEATKILEKVGLKGRMRNRGSQLSGGEKQRCVIARALASNCEILCCDEPTGNLDSETGAEIIKLIKEVAENKLVLIVTHNYEQVKDIVTRKIKIEDGAIVEDRYIDASFKDADMEKAEIDLDYKPIPKKTNFRISLNNLTSTPRKTTLIGIILFFTCIIALFMYQSIYTSIVDVRKNGEFSYIANNKIVVSDYNHGELSSEKLNKISSNYFTNEFYYDLDDRADITLVTTTNYYTRDAVYEPKPKDYSIKLGSKATETNEINLLFNPTVYTKSDIKEYLNNYISLSFYRYIGTTKYLVKGVGFSNSISNSNVVIVNNETVHSQYRLFGLLWKNNVNFNYDLKYTFDLSVKSSFVVKDTANEFKISYFENPMYDASAYTTVDTTISTNELTVGSDFFDSTYMTAYEATLYGNKSKMKKKAKKANLYIIDVETYTTMSKLMLALTHLGSYAAMIGSTLMMVVIYFISYAILAVIFRSKSEAYNIFRTLGVTKNDMKWIVINETMISVTFMSIFVYLAGFIAGKIIPPNPYFNLLASYNLPVTIMYFIVMLGIGWLLGRRFNRKLFNFTVREGLKQVK